MALHRPFLIKLLAPVLTFTSALALLLLLNRSSSPPNVERANLGGLAAPGRSTDDRIAALQSALKADSKNTDAYVNLGNTYLQKVRETGDSSFYVRAQSVLNRAVNQAPRNAGALTGMASLALARHDFTAGLRYGLQAHSIAPHVAVVYGVVVDAQVELGRY